MKDLLKTILEQWIQKRWLKAIGKAIDEHNRIAAKLNAQVHVVNTLVERYKEIYGKDLRAPKKETEAALEEGNTR